MVNKHSISIQKFISNNFFNEKKKKMEKQISKNAMERAINL